MHPRHPLIVRKSLEGSTPQRAGIRESQRRVQKAYSLFVLHRDIIFGGPEGEEIKRYQQT